MLEIVLDRYILEKVTSQSVTPSRRKQINSQRLKKRKNLTLGKIRDIERRPFRNA